MTVNRGIVIAGGVLILALAALAIALALALGGGGDNAGAGSEPAPAATEAPANLEECLEQQGLDPDLLSGDIHGGDPADVRRFFESCAQFLHEGGGTPGGGGFPFGP